MEDIARRPKKPGVTKTAAPSVRLEQAFIKAFTERWGFAPIIRQARDRKLLNDLVAAWGEADVLKLIPVFFTTTLPLVRRCRYYNIPDFVYCAPHIRLALSNRKADVHPRTADNIHEALKALGQKG